MYIFAPSVIELIDLISSGKIEKFKEYLTKYPDLYKIRDSDERTLLHHAARLKQVEIVRYLLAEKNADPNVLEGLEQTTPLMLAIKYQNESIVTLLLKAGANPNATTTTVSGYPFVNPLITALVLSDPEDEAKHLAIIKILLENGAIANLPADIQDVETPLHHAVKKGSLDIVCLLLQYKASVDTIDSTGSTPLHHAAQLGLVKVTKLLLDTLGNNLSLLEKPNHEGMTPMMLAVTSGHVGVMQLFIDKKMNINMFTYFPDKKIQLSPLFLSILNKQDNAADLLLSNNANPNTVLMDGKTPLHYAVECNTPAIVSLLIKFQASVVKQDAKLQTPLHTACLLGRLDIVDILIKANPHIDYINMQDQNGNTPLHLAAANGSIPIVLTLLKCGAEFDAKNKNGKVPVLAAAERQIKLNKKLLEAAGENNTEALNALVLEGAHVETRSHEPPRNSALLKTIYHDNLASASTLLKAGANIHARNNTQEGAIALLESVAMLNLILSFGTPDVTENDIKMLLTRVIEKKNTDFAQKLLSLPLCASFLPAISSALARSFIQHGQHQDLAFILTNGFISPDISILDHVFVPCHDIEIPILLYAAQSKNINIVKAILHAKPNTTITDKEGNTLLHCAAQNIHYNLIPLFHEYNISWKTVDLINNAGLTPLILAITKGNCGVVASLLNDGANIDAIDREGNNIFSLSVGLQKAPVLAYHALSFCNVTPASHIAVFLENNGVNKNMMCQYVLDLAAKAYEEKGIVEQVNILKNAVEGNSLLAQYMHSSYNLISLIDMDPKFKIEIALKKLRSNEEYKRAVFHNNPPPPSYISQAVAPPSLNVEQEKRATCAVKRMLVNYFQQYESTDKMAQHAKKLIFKNA